MAKRFHGRRFWLTILGMTAFLDVTQALAQDASPPGIKTIKKGSPWAQAPTAADLKAVEPPGTEPAALRVECRAGSDGRLNGCSFDVVHGGDAAIQAARALLPKYRLSALDADRLVDEDTYAVFNIVWRNPNKCLPPTCLGVVPPAPPPPRAAPEF